MQGFFIAAGDSSSLLIAAAHGFDRTGDRIDTVLGDQFGQLDRDAAQVRASGNDGRNTRKQREENVFARLFGTVGNFAAGRPDRVRAACGAQRGKQCNGCTNALELADGVAGDMAGNGAHDSHHTGHATLKKEPIAGQRLHLGLRYDTEEVHHMARNTKKQPTTKPKSGKRRPAETPQRRNFIEDMQHGEQRAEAGAGQLQPLTAAPAISAVAATTTPVISTTAATTTPRSPHSVRPPALIVVDDFLPDPDALRAVALQAKYQQQGSAGVRSLEHAPFADLAPRLAKLMGYTIDWHKYPINGRFQYCVAKDPIVYHTDMQRWAGVLFLTPDAPVDSGVQLLRSRINGQRKCATDADAKLMFANNHFDGTRWDTVDWIGNVYNRLVIWDGHLTHAPVKYFGDNISNARLFIVFFFD